jgi:hypothetical protein
MPRSRYITIPFLTGLSVVVSLILLPEEASIVDAANGAFQAVAQMIG